MKSNNEKHTNNDPIILMELLKILNENKEKKWITIPTLTNMINMSIMNPIKTGIFGATLDLFTWRDYTTYTPDWKTDCFVNEKQIRLEYLPQLQQSTDIQVNYGVVVSSTRGIMLTNDTIVIDRFIEVEEARAKTIFRKLKVVKEAKKRLEIKKLYINNGQLIVDGGKGWTLNEKPTKEVNSFKDIDIMAKELFLDEYWDIEWNGDNDYTEEKEELWENDAELREEWYEKFNKKI